LFSSFNLAVHASPNVFVPAAGLSRICKTLFFSKNSSYFALYLFKNHFQYKSVIKHDIKVFPYRPRLIFRLKAAEVLTEPTHKFVFGQRTCLWFGESDLEQQNQVDFQVGINVFSQGSFILEII
jgi:hypothetical protein